MSTGNNKSRIGRALTSPRSPIMQPTAQQNLHAAVNLECPDGSVTITETAHATLLQASSAAPDVFATAQKVGDTVNLKINGTIRDPERNRSGYFTQIQSVTNVFNLENVDWAAIDASTDPEPGTVWFVRPYRHIKYRCMGIIRSWDGDPGMPSQWGPIAAVVSSDLPISTFSPEFGSSPGLRATYDFRRLVIDDIHSIHENSPLQKLFGIRFYSDGAGNFENFELLEAEGRHRTLSEQPLPWKFNNGRLFLMDYETHRGHYPTTSDGLSPWELENTRVDLPHNATTNIYWQPRTLSYFLDVSLPKITLTPYSRPCARVVLQGRNIHQIESYVPTWDRYPGFTPDPLLEPGLSSPDLYISLKASDDSTIRMGFDRETGRILGVRKI